MYHIQYYKKNFYYNKFQQVQIYEKWHSNQTHAVKDDDAYHHSMMHGSMVSSAHTAVVLHVCTVDTVMIHMSFVPMTVIHVTVIHQSLYNHTTIQCQQQL